jgi:hypothetical protein
MHLLQSSNYCTCFGPWLQFDQQGKLLVRPCQINIQANYRTQAEESVKRNSKTFQTQEKTDLWHNITSGWTLTVDMHLYVGN